MAYPRQFQHISQVEILGRAGTARQLVAGSASSNTPLSADINRISIRAVGADIRFSIGTGTQTQKVIPQCKKCCEDLLP